ncbi:MAG TPA: hypothetical protein VD860_09445 [Azospirillum sp.]|nr:hypothetical protein [Azospirillum sp.]
MPVIQLLLDQIGWRPSLAVLALVNLALGMTLNLAAVDRGTDAPAPSAPSTAGRTSVGWALRRPAFWGLMVAFTV